jgi:hypothetical protein
MTAGDIILRDGRLWRVGLLNSCRMRLDPLEGHAVTLTTPGGDTRTFQAYGRSENIAPSAEYPLATAEDVARVARRVARLEKHGGPS